MSTHSSGGSVGKSSGTSPSHLRSHDIRKNSLEVSPSLARSHGPHSQSHDQRKHSLPVSPSNVPYISPSADSQHTQAVQQRGQSTRSHSRSPQQQSGNVSSTSVPPNNQGEAPSDSPPQPYHHRLSERVTQLQNDPQVPALIQQIDDLMDGLLDSPQPERKQPSSTSPNTVSTFERPQEPAWQQQQQKYPVGARDIPSHREGATLSESPFPKNINPADFIREEEMMIDPRNFLNTPSPEPNILDLKGAVPSETTSGSSARAHLHLPLVGGILSSVC